MHGILYIYPQIKTLALLMSHAKFFIFMWQGTLPNLEISILLTEVVPHPETTKVGPSSTSDFVFNLIGPTDSGILRSKGSLNFKRQTSLLVALESYSG